MNAQREAPETHESARDHWRSRKRQVFATVFRPRPHLSLSEWADRHRVLSKETSAEPGPWRTDRVPYLRQIMNAVSDPEVQELVVMKAARVGYTEGIVGNSIGYYVDQDPSPILVVQPTEGDAQDWSKKQLMPMLRDTPRLAGKVAESRARDSGNTILDKAFAGGSLAIRGAHSPKGLRRLTARVVLFDEIDGYEESAGSEGDPVKLGEKRADTFPNRKLIKGSTPLIKGRSRIEADFERSDQRRYHVPCPHCGHEQVLRWGGKDTPFGIKWEDGNPETAGYQCEECAAIIEERDKPDMIRRGRWVATNPDSKVPGWHLPALISLFDGARWERLVAEFLDAKSDPERLQVFVNTVLGETWEENEQRFDPDDLAARREAYAAGVPDGVGVLTAGVDVQSDRLEIAVKGWGADEESWLILHERLHGDPEKDDVWERLEAIRSRAYRHGNGRELRIRTTMIDSGFCTDRVYAYVRPRQLAGVFASKGLDSRASELLKRASRANRYRVKLWSLATPRFKDIIFRRLRTQRPGPGFMHFCQQTSTGADAEYFAQFASERSVLVKSGRRYVRAYKQVRDRNEALDLEVLNLAALHSLGTAVRDRLDTLADQARQPVENEADEKDDQPARRSGRRRNYVNAW